MFVGSVTKLRPNIRVILSGNALYRAIVQVLFLTVIFTLAVFLTILLIKSSEQRINYLPVLIITGASALIFSLISGFFFYRKINRAIEELNTAAQRMLKGDYQIHLTPSRFAEFNRLFFTFHQLTDAIRANYRELRQKKGWLTAILNSIQEGLLVLDDRGRILIANTSFRQIAGTKPVEDQFYWQVLRNPVLSDVISDLQSRNARLSRKMELGGRQFLINGSLSPTGEKVITFSDISEIVQASTMKRDFIQNVSHELRTPLTAIKGYIETMAETATDQNRNYLHIIKRHTDRLIRIVNDLLTLSQLESPQVQLETEVLNVQELFNDVLTVLRPAIQQKGLQLDLAIPDPSPKIKGDRLYLEQALINLLDNAVRYTEKGKITINAETNDNRVSITVADTGIGIAPEHQARIFERFYVVDRTRSRQSGGTGLGLAIVKHIITIHNGEINVESIPGLGSKFTLILPNADE